MELGIIMFLAEAEKYFKLILNVTLQDNKEQMFKEFIISFENVFLILSTNT